MIDISITYASCRYQINVSHEQNKPRSYILRQQCLTAYLKNGKLLKLPYLIDFETHRTAYKTPEVDTRYGGIILYYSENDRFKNSDYLPAVGWNSLAIRLYQRGELSDIFVPIYPTNGDDDAEFKIWEIHYPPDIQSDPKYRKISSSE